MARVEVPVTVLNGTTGLPVAGASIAITTRPGGVPATWYPTETGGSGSTAAVITDSNGRALAWVERGAYTLSISGTGITPYTEAWDATPGGDNSIDSGWISGVDAAKITSGTLPTARIGDSTLTADKMVAAVATAAGLNTSGIVRRGKFVLGTNQTIASATYAFATTPDVVPGVVVPTDGLLFIQYRALIKPAASITNKAAIFIGSNQLVVPSLTGTPAVSEASIAGGSSPNYTPLMTVPNGLYGTIQGPSLPDGQFGTTGTALSLTSATSAVMPGLLIVDVPAGTYDIGVKFFAPGAATINIKERVLRVWTEGY